MPLNDNGKNACLTGGLGNAITHISLHTGVPDDTGSTEVSGGSYARIAVTWTAAASGVRDNNALLTHEVPASTTVTAYGFWSALTAGTFYGYAPLNGTTKGFGTVDSGGVTNDLITSNGHGLSADHRVIVYNVFSESLPTGLTEGTLYWVISTGLTADAFKISTTQGGAAVNITGQGELYFQRCTPEVFSSAGQLTTATGALDLDATGI